MASDITQPAGEEPRLDLRFTGRTAPSTAETAAVIAVVTAAIEQREPAAAEAAPGDQWVRSGGALRRPIEPGPGRWQRALR
ncbi:acyl-CoA carboxylase epsilon subunit [Agromyces soli]